MSAINKEDGSRRHIRYRALIVGTMILVSVAFIVDRNTPVTSLGNGQITIHQNNSKKKIDLGELNRSIENLQKRLTRIEENQRSLTRELWLSKRGKGSGSVYTKLARAADNSNDQDSWKQDYSDETLDDVNIRNEKLEQEIMDTNWASELEVAIGLVLDENNISDLLVEQIDCRETLCRFEFVHATETEIERFFESVHTHEAFSGEINLRTSVDEYDEKKTQVFLSRSRENLEPPLGSEANTRLVE